MTAFISKLLKGAAVAGALVGSLYATPARADTIIERGPGIRAEVVGPRVAVGPRVEIGGPVVRVEPAFHEFAPIRFEPRRGWRGGYGWHGGFGGRGDHGWGGRGFGGHGFGGHGFGGRGSGGHGWNGRR